MTDVKTKEQAKDYVIERLDRIKNLAINTSAIAEKFNLFSDNPSKIMNISCECDDLTGELEEA
jgi:archaellum component FlaC